uniref:Retrotransposon protein, putative, unclassified n=1 Tax=Oryza sativa subsp. japonica TaxID=39947 RepID=Q10RS4_ORYSJ|nr:retrotransposon protein, putative, unclassified [Oryza sativa Japonica Group]
MNWEGMYKRKKQEIMGKIEDIDKKCEAYGMTILERKERGDLEEELKKVVREDRLKWMQRCKEKNLLEGDDNTKYYHAKANGRKRKNMIYSLDQEDGEIKGQSDLMKYITNFYKQLFGPPPENDFTLNLEGIAMLSEAEKERLIRPIEMEELKKVVFGMENNKAPGPDGFPVEFYKHFWYLIKDDLMELIIDFMKRKIGVERLNYGVITLIPKCKEAGILFKIDFEKVYDNIKWSFVYKMMKAKGFPDIWCDWILKVVKGGKVAIRVNYQIGHYFTTHKGLRQGDPLSPLLFNIAADALTLLIKRAEQQGLIKGLGMDVMREGVDILQYADDTICLIQDSLEYAKNLKFIMCIFEQLTGLKVNFHKSEVFCLGEAAERQDSYSQMFTCQIGRLPMKYLGVPIDQRSKREG